jgi:hypothetical protein
MMTQVHVLNVFAGDTPTDCLGDDQEARIGPIAFPPPKRNGLNFPETKGWIDGIKPDRQVGAALSRTSSLVPNEIALCADRALGPNDDNAFGRIEMFLDIFAPMGAAADMSVPPDGETFFLKRGDQRAESRSVFGLV